ncbi:hypothetical protein [Ensifer sp. ZNC0028]|uniref:hypothetical protein n=1 Tax=Ensifer sp. ZNC0028 TaxID=1339236 RepID=UPI0012E02D6B|nr:hypothetical protein [Ensifer sp. ZNC0028]
MQVHRTITWVALRTKRKVSPGLGHFLGEAFPARLSCLVYLSNIRWPLAHGIACALNQRRLTGVEAVA